MSNRSAPLEAMVGTLGCVIDPQVGIIRQVEIVPREAGSPDFFHVAGKACDTGAFTRQTNFGATGGASRDLEIAVAKAAGEAIERYCSARMWQACRRILRASDSAARLPLQRSLTWA